MFFVVVAAVAASAAAATSTGAAKVTPEPSTFVSSSSALALCAPCVPASLPILHINALCLRRRRRRNQRCLGRSHPTLNQTIHLTQVLWKWGPVTQYQLELTGVDSIGDGGSDVS